MYNILEAQTQKDITMVKHNRGGKQCKEEHTHIQHNGGGERKGWLGDSDKTFI